MSARVLVVVSGLPASGTSRVGDVLSAGLSLPLLDKDAILEALFDELGCEDRGQRERLSRASDEVLFRLAAASPPGVVVVNWWNHDTSPQRLREVAGTVVEVFCDCPLEAGISTLRDPDRGPLRLGGPVVTVDTSTEVDVEALVAEVRAAVSAGDAAQVVAAAEERASALAAGDAVRLTRLLHPDFTWTTHTGDVHDRTAYVDRNTGGTTVWRSQRLTATAVDVVGDTAVLRATVVDEVASGDGSAVFRMPMTQVWVRGDGAWTCLAGHAGPRLA